MDMDLDIDLSFLDDDPEEESSFDFNHFCDRPQDLFTFNCILVCNMDPDIRVLEFSKDSDVALYIKSHFAENAIQTIVKNNHEESRGMCPYFRIVMDGFSEDAPINFKLQSMYKRMGIESMSSRCSHAMIIGLTTMSHLESPISVPYCFMTTSLDPMDFVCEDDEIDLVCLSSCSQKLNPQATDLCDIAGMTLPYFLPFECQMNILKYLRSSEADMILLAMDCICLSWDIALHPMFLQREPRIPFHLASYYNASTVLSTVEDATRPFLATPAPRRDLTVLPSWMTSLSSEH